MTIYTSGDFGRLLRDRRRGLGLTQAHAAQLSGVSTRLWSECEGGKRPQVGFETAIRMLQTVGADLTAIERRRRALPAAP